MANESSARPPALPAIASRGWLAGHPTGLKTLFLTEMWERFSYYGMRAILVFFMIEAVNSKRSGLGLDDATATAIYGLYTSLVYLVALPGGWIADHLLGARRSVWYGGLIIAAGHFTLALHSTHAFFLGLLLIIIGTGLLKPNISAIVGDLYPEGGARRDAGFTIFYMGVNLGATLGTTVCSFLGEKHNFHYGFAAAGFGMALGLLQYRLTGDNLGEAGLRPRRRETAVSSGFDKGWLLVAAAMAVVCSVAVLGFAGVIKFNPVVLAKKVQNAILILAGLYFVGIFAFGKLTPVEKKRMVVFLILLLACAMFWAGFEQAGSSLNIFAKEFTKRTIPWINYEVPAGFFQNFNPIFIITLAPVMAALWVALARRKADPSIPAKFAWGLILLGAGFLVMVVASKLVGPGKRVMPTWLILTYLLHTFGELCLSPVGLSATTKLAPRRFTGQMLGMWFLATALGNLIAGRIAGEAVAGSAAQMPAMFMKIVMTTAGTGLVLLIFSRPIKRLMGNIE